MLVANEACRSRMRLAQVEATKVGVAPLEDRIFLWILEIYSKETFFATINFINLFTTGHR